MGNEKNVTLRIDDYLLKEFRSLSKYYGRSMNGQLLYMIRKSVDDFKKKHGDLELPEDE